MQGFLVSWKNRTSDCTEWESAAEVGQTHIGVLVPEAHNLLLCVGSGTTKLAANRLTPEIVGYLKMGEEVDVPDEIVRTAIAYMEARQSLNTFQQGFIDLFPEDTYLTMSLFAEAEV